MHLYGGVSAHEWGAHTLYEEVCVHMYDCV
jgi:hypothetical protein